MYSPLKAYRLFWARLFSFKGRSTRSEYWWTFIPVQFTFFYLLINQKDILLYVYFLFHTFENVEQIEKMAAFLLSGLILLLAINMFSISARRLHDINMSGWWSILIIVPFGIFLLWFLALFPSKHKHTKYGADPTANPDEFYHYYLYDPNRRDIPYGGLFPIQNTSNQPAMATASVSEAPVDLTKRP